MSDGETVQGGGVPGPGEGAVLGPPGEAAEIAARLLGAKKALEEELRDLDAQAAALVREYSARWQEWLRIREAMRRVEERVLVLRGLLR